MNAAVAQTAEPATETHLGFPRDRNDILWLTFESRLQRFAHTRGKPVIPRGLNQDPAYMRIAGSGEFAAVLRRSPLMFAGHQSQISHEFSRMGKTPQITEFRSDSRRRQKINSAKR